MDKDFTVSVIIAAAGKGTRAGLDINKVYARLGKQPVLVSSILPFFKIPQVCQMVVSISGDDISIFEQHVLNNPEIKKYKEKIKVITGGNTRQESVYNGLLQTNSECTLVAVHDGARPLIKQKDILNVLEKALSTGAACLGVKMKDTVKRVDHQLRVIDTLKREELIAVQTPQVFKREILMDSYQKAMMQNCQGSDDATLVETAGYPVTLVLGSYDNIKITTPEDFLIAERILEEKKL